MALQGSLTDFGIAEILQLIGSQQKTGILHVDAEGDAPSVQIYLSSGRIIRCEAVGKGYDGPVARLVGAGLITREQLADVLRQSRKTNTSGMKVAVDMHLVDLASVNEFVRLDARETLFRLFELKAGRYRFESKPPNFARATVSPMSAESILMEGFRILDEWPLIRTKINNYHTVYQVIRQLNSGEDDAQALERILDDAFTEFAGTSDEAPTGGVGLEPAERKVLGLVDGERDVNKLIGLSRLGEFETCKALLTLLSEGYIAPTKNRRAMRAPGRGEPLRWHQVALRVAINLAALSAVVAVVLFMPQSRGELKANTAQVAAEAQARLRANKLLAIGGALEVFRLEVGEYPQTLDELVKAGLADASILGTDVPVDYTSVGTDYDLR